MASVAPAAGCCRNRQARSLTHANCPPFSLAPRSHPALTSPRERQILPPIAMNDLPLPQNDTNNALDVSRRDFVKTSSFAAAMSMLGGVPLFAQDAKPAAPAVAPYDGPTVKCAVIGLGVWGREIL